MAVMIEPAASKVASLLPGEIIVSPSNEEKPFEGKDFFKLNRYSHHRVCL